jgi:peptidoglycan L-alanyl-D-glutamate endopeptidase CwlK
MLNSRDINLLRPDVAVNCRILIDRAAKVGRKVLVTETVRDDEYQAYLYAQGRTRAGAIITNSSRPTFHSIKAGLAFDVCQNIKGREYNDEGFWQIVGSIGKEIGFTWGGDWKSIVDKPHFQWDDHGKYTSSMILAGKYPPTMPLYEGEDDMTKEDVLKIIQEYEAQKAKEPLPAWAKKELDEAIKLGITDGSNPCAPIPRYQAAIMALRAMRK